MAPQPRQITRSDPRRIEFEWDNGEHTELTAIQLRAMCPCAACVDELTGVRRHDPRSVPEDMQHTDVRLVGNYALTMGFSDGHNTGIYPFPMLWEHGRKA
ncbi:MAG: DUF971 domain-containing protein [Planctomycetes bacterium]|nr:DUF971 domain-containing protein [Planctomycetota bacterium]